MKNINKFIAIVLCFLLVTTSFAMVSAEESEFSGIVSKEFEVSENGDVEVLIDIAGNPGITSLSLKVSYDSDVLTLKENGFVDTEILVGNITTALDRNPFRLSWQHSDASAQNNYKNGTIAKLYFKMKDDFCGSTDIAVDVYSAQTMVDDEFVRPPAMENGVITVTRKKLAIKDGVAIANGLDGETLMIASYDGNKMIDCKAYSNAAGNVKITIADVLNTSGATKVKAFLWENLENCMPVYDCVEEEL